MQIMPDDGYRLKIPAPDECAAVHPQRLKNSGLDVVLKIHASDLLDHSAKPDIPLARVAEL